MQNKKFQHNWDFMANSNNPKEGDLCYCSLCNQWCMDGYKNGKPFKMSRSEFMEWHIAGKIDASSSFGTVEEAKAKYQEQYGR